MRMRTFPLLSSVFVMFTDAHVAKVLPPQAGVARASEGAMNSAIAAAPAANLPTRIPAPGQWYSAANDGMQRGSALPNASAAAWDDVRR